MVYFQNCTRGFELLDPLASTNYASKAPIVVATPDAVVKSGGCQLELTSIPDQGHVVAYQADHSSGKATCNDLKEDRVCDRGSLSGTFPYTSCVDTLYKSCSLIGLTTAIPGNGGQAVAYQTSNVPYTDQCVFGLVTCTNGVLSGSDYRYGSCVRQRRNCTFNGQTVTDSATIGITAYQNATVPTGSTCVSEQRYCNDGSLSGSFPYGSCSVGSNPCTLDGKMIADGASLTAYQAPNAMGACASTSRQCNNGVLGGDSSFALSSCPDAKGCTVSIPGFTVVLGSYNAATQKCIYPACSGPSSLDCQQKAHAAKEVDGRLPQVFNNAKSLCLFTGGDQDFYAIKRTTVLPGCGYGYGLANSTGSLAIFQAVEYPLCYLGIDTGFPLLTEVWCTKTVLPSQLNTLSVALPASTKGYYNEVPFDKDPHDNTDPRYCTAGVNPDGSCYYPDNNSSQ